MLNAIVFATKMTFYLIIIFSFARGLAKFRFGGVIAPHFVQSDTTKLSFVNLLNKLKYYKLNYFICFCRILNLEQNDVNLGQIG